MRNEKDNSGYNNFWLLSPSNIIVVITKFNINFIVHSSAYQHLHQAFQPWDKEMDSTLVPNIKGRLKIYLDYETTFAPHWVYVCKKYCLSDESKNLVELSTKASNLYTILPPIVNASVQAIYYKSLVYLKAGWIAWNILTLSTKVAPNIRLCIIEI